MQLKVESKSTVPGQRAAALAVARALIPTTEAMDGASLETVLHAETFMEKVVAGSLPAWRAAHVAVDQAARVATGHPLHELSARRAEELLERWSTAPALGRVVAFLGTIYKLAHFDMRDVRGGLGSPLRVVQTPEVARWESQIVRAESLDPSEEIECDVVVIGTGAGGAVVGRHLADQGHAVVFVEEGEHVKRHQFPGTLKRTIEELYRNVIGIGNQSMLVSQGRLVGGSTAVNTGTSFRPPRWVMDRWCEDLGSDDFRPEALEPYFDRVESILQVEPADVRYAGPVYELFRRGADAMGWHSDTIRRNAPGCRGEGMCDNGCPTDAKRSTLIAYLPGALERGNMVLSALRAEEVLISGGRAVGLVGTALRKNREPALGKDGKPKRITIKARAVVIAAGAMTTPTFLLQQKLCNSSGQVGRNLTLHPSGPSLGLFDEVVRGQDYIPQTAYSHEFLKEGIMLLSAHADAAMMPPTTSLLGQRLMHVFERSDHTAGMGFLLADSTTGRIRLAPGGRTLLTYNMTRKDVERMKRAQVLLAELMLAAGAREVFPGITPAMTIFDRAGVERLARMKLAATDFLLTSYHPLGTARMSRSPKDGVVDLDHQTHDVPGLYIVDGSTVRGPLGVNPQITIMGLATRAAERIGRALA